MNTTDLSKAARNADHSPTPPGGRTAGLAAIASAAAVALAGCGIAQGTPDPESVRVDLTSYLAQPLDWQDCPPANQDPYLSQWEETPDLADGLQCAKASVPADYFHDDSDLEDLTISLVKVPAAGEQTGQMLVNPGGPGASGWEFAALQAKEFQTQFPGMAIIGFDPRGVKRSTAFTCDQSDKHRVADLAADSTPSNQRELERMLRHDDRDLQECQQAYPAWGHLGTSSVVEDMHLINQLLGNTSGLDYYGVSYGSVIGHEYLRRYPEDINRMILESPVDPPQFGNGEVDQMAAFDERIDKLVVECARTDSCGQGRTVDQTRKAVTEALSELEEPGWRKWSPGRHASQNLVRLGMIAPLYWNWNRKTTKRYTFWYLQALSSLINERTAGRFEWWGFDHYGYNPETDRFRQDRDGFEWIVCLDASQDDPAVIRANDEHFRAAAIESAPYLSAIYFSGERYDDNQMHQPCPVAEAAWADDRIPDPERGPLPSPVNPTGVPVLVLGVSDDTATPHEWAETVAENLGVPLTTQTAKGHGVYLSTPTKCATAIVTRYLQARELPSTSQTCQ